MNIIVLTNLIIEKGEWKIELIVEKQKRGESRGSGMARESKIRKEEFYL